MTREAQNETQARAVSPVEMARWLRADVAPRLASDRQRELAEQAARRFEQRNVVR